LNNFCNSKVYCSPFTLVWAFKVFASDEIAALGAREDADLHAVEGHEVFVVHILWNYHHCFHAISIPQRVGQRLSNPKKSETFFWGKAGMALAGVNGCNPLIIRTLQALT